jgi:hypothetical protein
VDELELTSFNVFDLLFEGVCGSLFSRRTPNSLLSCTHSLDHLILSLPTPTIDVTVLPPSYTTHLCEKHCDAQLDILCQAACGVCRRLLRRTTKAATEECAGNVGTSSHRYGPIIRRLRVLCWTSWLAGLEQLESPTITQFGGKHNRSIFAFFLMVVWARSEWNRIRRIRVVNGTASLMRPLVVPRR